MTAEPEQPYSINSKAYTVPPATLAQAILVPIFCVCPPSWPWRAAAAPVPRVWLHDTSMGRGVRPVQTCTNARAARRRFVGVAPTALAPLAHGSPPFSPRNLCGCQPVFATHHFNKTPFRALSAGVVPTTGGAGGRSRRCGNHVRQRRDRHRHTAPHSRVLQPAPFLCIFSALRQRPLADPKKKPSSSASKECTTPRPPANSTC